MRKGPQRDARKERFWRAAVRQQECSGQSIRGYCRGKGLSEPLFYAWRRELKRRGGEQARKLQYQTAQKSQRRPGKKPAFVSVKLSRGTVLKANTVTEGRSGWIECHLPSGAVLRLPAEMEPAAIAAVVTNWERSLC